MQLLKYSGCELGHHPTEKMIDPILFAIHIEKYGLRAENENIKGGIQ